MIPSLLQSVGRRLPLCRLLSGFAAGAALLLIGWPTGAKMVFGFGSPVDQKYDFTKVLAALHTNAVLAAKSPMVSAALEVTSNPGVTMKNHKSSLDTWPYLFLTQDAGARKAVREVTHRVLLAQGVSAASDNGKSLKVSIVLDRFTAEKPHQKSGGLIPLNFKGEDRTRHAFIEGRLAVTRDGQELYARKLAFQATRVFGKAGDIIGHASPLAGEITGAKEDAEGNRSLLTEVLAKLQEELAKDTDLRAALMAAPLSTVETAKQAE